MPDEESTRTDFSRRELAKLARAVEAIQDDERLEAELRIADLEEQIVLLKRQVKSEAKAAYRNGFRNGKNEWAELTERWRQAFESLCAILAESGPNGDMERVEERMRVWIGEA